MNGLSVAIFGAAGALLRYAAGLWAHSWWGMSFPIGTLLVNYAGCLLLGLFSAWTASKPNLPSWLRLGIGTGFVGAFTTFSTFSYETVALFQAGLAEIALLYVLLSLIGGLVFAWGGQELFQVGLRRKARRVHTR